ncbi:MAG: acyl-CoA dehydrogenase family protein [Acidimicrobiales bacterium]
MEATELELFERSIRHATETATGEALDMALADLGWVDALGSDPSLAISRLFESQGAANVASSALDYLLDTALGGDGHAAVILPPLRRHDVPGALSPPTYTVRGLATAALSRRGTAVVVARSEHGHVALSCKTADLEVRPVEGLDPTLGIVEVSGELRDAERIDRLVDWEAAVAIGQLALGHELVGTARAMLELARLHALDRIQFGRPISAFQAVRHRLADGLVMLEAAAGLLDAAWEDPSPLTAAMAKGLAGRSARTVGRHCQQVLAGIGFTTEHPLHHYVRRSILLDQVLGAGSVLTRELGAAMLSGRAPTPLPL